MFDALKAPNLPRFARITAVEVASHRRGDKSTVEYEVKWAGRNEKDNT